MKGTQIVLTGLVVVYGANWTFPLNETAVAQLCYEPFPRELCEALLPGPRNRPPLQPQLSEVAAATATASATFDIAPWLDRKAGA